MLRHLRLQYLYLPLLALCPLAPSRAVSPEPAPAKPTIVIVHGAWGGAWQFARIEPFLREKGFAVRRLTLTGLGERSHLASADIGLETHIRDVENVLLFENLRDIILLGHSYGGMVITGVADRMPERIARLVYLDALLPGDGESVMSLRRPGASFDLEKMTRDGFVVPTWVRPGKPHPIDVPHPFKTFTDPIALRNPLREKIPAIYILTVEAGKSPDEDDFFFFAERARKRGWTILQMEADHNPHWRLPAPTSELIARSAAPIPPAR